MARAPLARADDAQKPYLTAAPAQARGSSAQGSNAAGSPGGPWAMPATPRSTFPRSLAVFPEQTITVRFNHKVHLEAGANCESCHESALKSEKSSDLNLPRAITRPGKYPEHPECDNCHDIDAAAAGKRTDPPATCDYCHPGFDYTVQKLPARWSFPDPNIVFPHKVHVDKKVACGVCHQDMASVALATRDELPKMEVCLTCHDGRQAPNACSTCHPTAARGGRLLVSFGNTPAKLRPGAGNPFGIDHGIRFDKNHGSRAMMEQNTCSECHADSECLSCHDSLLKPLTVHPNDYITLHPLEARQNSLRCDACHRRQSFCASCHERVGVGFDADPSLRPRNMRVHPPPEIWVNLPVTAGHHSIAATRDIESCASCHREETCMSCHSNLKTDALRPHSQFGALSVPSGQLPMFDPHPAGFQAICKYVASKNTRVCLECHAKSPGPGVPNGTDLTSLGCL